MDYYVYNHFNPIKVQVTKRLKHAPKMPCGVIIDKYNNITLIAFWRRQVITLTPKGYIVTFPPREKYAGKMISAFLKEYAPHIKYTDIKEKLNYQEPIYVGSALQAVP